MTDMSSEFSTEKRQGNLPIEPGGPAPEHVVKLRYFLNSNLFQWTILGLIFANAMLLGIETMPMVSEGNEQILLTIDFGFLLIFLIELALRIYAWRTDFFRNGWNLFDFTIILVSALAFSNLFAALRAFRVLRVLHLVTILPRMRTVVRALIDSIPGILSVGVLVVLIVYVFAVIASNLYGDDHPEIFGNVFTSMYTLFQVMTLEGWADIAAEVGETSRYAWIFFISFLLIGTFTMLNLFVAIVVRVVEEDSEETEELVVRETDEVQLEVQGLRKQIETLTEMVARIEQRRDVDIDDQSGRD